MTATLWNAQRLKYDALAGKLLRDKGGYFHFACDFGIRTGGNAGELRGKRNPVKAGLTAGVAEQLLLEDARGRSFGPGCAGTNQGSEKNGAT